MTEHLPECPMKPIAEAPVDFYQVFPDCICGPLRACEERVTRAIMHTVDVDSYEEGKRDCKETHPALALKEITRIASKGYDAGYSAGYEKAVSDAQWLLEEHVNSIGWIALTKMKPNND